MSVIKFVSLVIAGFAIYAFGVKAAILLGCVIVIVFLFSLIFPERFERLTQTFESKFSSF